MPTYNYYCSNCEEKFVYFQQINEEAFSKCKKCNKEINRVISGGMGLIFKGTGFYETDYNNKKSDKKDTEEKGKKSKKDNNKQLKSNKEKKKSE